MTDQEFNEQYDNARSNGARILDELCCAAYFGALSAEDLWESLCERLDEGDPINTEETEMKTILDEIADRLGRLEDIERVFSDEYKAANQIKPEDAHRIYVGLKLGWTEPSRNTFSGRLGGHPPDSLMIDVWPEFQ